MYKQEKPLDVSAYIPHPVSSIVCFKSLRCLDGNEKLIVLVNKRSKSTTLCLSFMICMYSFCYITCDTDLDSYTLYKQSNRFRSSLSLNSKVILVYGQFYYQLIVSFSYQRSVMAWNLNHFQLCPFRYRLCFPMRS